MLLDIRNLGTCATLLALCKPLLGTITRISESRLIYFSRLEGKKVQFLSICYPLIIVVLSSLVSYNSDQIS